MKYGEIVIKKCLKNHRLNKKDKLKLLIMIIIYKSKDLINFLINKKLINKMKNL